MRHWWQLATRNWRTRPARSLLAVTSIALGVGVVVWVTCCYESVRVSVTRAVLDWIGRSHIVVEPRAGVWGVFSQDLAERIRPLPGIADLTMRTREYVHAIKPWPEQPSAENPTIDGEPPDAGFTVEDGYTLIEMMGVLPEREERFFHHKIARGRFLLPTDTDAIVIEQLLAREFGVDVGDSILLRHHTPPQPARAFKIVGIVDRRRASANQAMMVWGQLADVQDLCKLPGRVKAVDILLSDPTVDNIRRFAESVQQTIAAYNEERAARGEDRESVVVKTTEAQHQKLGAAQGLLQFVMLLLSSVVLLTAFFIILATMSMGVSEQITQLGLLRCIGLTRGQLAGVVLLQTMPLGVVGTAVGVPLGLLLHWITVQVNPEYLGEAAVHVGGVWIAVAGGIGTTLLGAAIPAVAALYVSPAEAARAHSGGRLTRWIWLPTAVGTGLIAAQEIIRSRMDAAAGGSFDATAVVGLLLLYAGAALLAPAAVLLCGRLAVHAAARLLALRPQLLGEEVHKAPFRAAAICCGLMVALSLIVGLIVWGRSVKQGWEFPKEFPDAMLYSYHSIPLDEVRALRNTPGIRQFTVIDDFPFYLRRPPRTGLLRSLSVMDQFSRFMAIDPEEGLSIAKLSFIEGREAEAVEKLRQGGHLLVTREFAQARNKRVGDPVTIWVEAPSGRMVKATFIVAGVVASPGVDIAISFFNASTYFQTYAVGAIIGTLDDAERLFQRRYGRLMLFNFDLPDADSSPIVSDSGQTVVPKTLTAADGRPSFAAGPGPVPGNGPEERIVNEMLARLDYPPKAFVTARELKHLIDSSIDRVTLLLSAIPAVGLIIAALGVANLMAASVAGRSRQIAVLRAVGLTRGQVLRMVIGEGLVLGLLGSVMGMALGVYLGQASNRLTEMLSGFRPEFDIPYGLVAAGAALAVGLCLIAVIAPARHAGRTNIVSALAD